MSAESRGASSKTLQALRALPGGAYRTIDEVLDAVPAEPEGDEARRYGPTGRAELAQPPTLRRDASTTACPRVKKLGRYAFPVDTVLEAVSRYEEVRPMNAVRGWVLPPPSRPGD